MPQVTHGLNDRESVGTGSLSIVRISAPHVNETEMSAVAIISTPKVDRAGHVVNPLGGDYSEYKKNPVVLWEHGLLRGDLSIPIARSEDADGELTVWPTAKGIKAKSFFSQRNKQSEQFFALIADKIIRATSVRFRPSETPVFKGGVKYYENWIFEEWSWTAFGVNPDAVADVVSKGRLAGSQMDHSIMKSLLAYMPTRKVQMIVPLIESVCKSCECGECKSCKEDDGEMTKKSVTKSEPVKDEDEKDKPDDQQSDKADGDATDGTPKPVPKDKDKPAPEDEPKYEQNEDDYAEENAEEAEQKYESAPSDTKSVTYGAKMLRATHKALRAVHQNMEGSFAELEHPGVKERLTGVHQQIGEMAEGVAGFFAHQYPSLPMEDPADAEEESLTKSLLASNVATRILLSQIIGELKEHGDDSPVLKSNIGRLEGILRASRVQAETARIAAEQSVMKSTPAAKQEPTAQPVASDEFAKAQAALADLRARYQEAHKQLTSLTGARK